MIHKLFVLTGALVLTTGLLTTPATADQRDRHERRDRAPHARATQHHRAGHHPPRARYHRNHASHQRHQPRFHRSPRHHRDTERFARHRGHIVAPTVLARDIAHTYRSYYDGRVYDRIHRHHHDVYRFPVATHAGTRLRAHYYCGRDLFRGHVSYRGPHLSFSLGF